MNSEKEAYIVNLLEGHSTFYKGAPALRVLLSHVQTRAGQAGCPFEKRDVHQEFSSAIATLSDAGKIELCHDGVHLKV